jgi:hypothetical protein
MRRRATLGMDRDCAAGKNANEKDARHCAREDSLHKKVALSEYNDKIPHVNAPRGFIRHNAFLAAAVALPLIVIAFFLVATAIPRWTVPPPAYDLVLRVAKPYEQRPQVSVEFKVDDGRIVAFVRPVQKDQYVQSWSLVRFDHQTSNLQEIPVKLPDSLAPDSPPQTIVVDGFATKRVLEQTKAPDGYELRTDTNRGGAGLMGDLFGMRGYDQRVVLVNRGRVITLPLPSGYQYAPVNAVGWLTDPQ